ncbi:hypothetical protein IWX91DRAFT_339608 [Phyllosticta citricarpa]
MLLSKPHWTAVLCLILRFAFLNDHICPGRVRHSSGRESTLFKFIVKTHFKQAHSSFCSFDIPLRRFPLHPSHARGSKSQQKTVPAVSK